MRQSFSLQALGAGLLAAFVGFASSFAIILEGLTSIGASPAEAASGLMALSIAMGAGGIILSLKSRLPISIAWSTPGAALLATTGPIAGGFAGAVGAFLVTGALIVLAGLWKPLGRWVAAIPAPLANAMLAGVLLGLCLAPVKAVAEAPLYGLVIVVTWVLVGRWKKLYAVPAAVLAAGMLILLVPPQAEGDGAISTGVVSAGVVSLGASLWPLPILVQPSFSVAGLVGIALPLFIVTMASQNIPGMAVLNVNEYRPAPGPLFTATGILSLIAAPFGGHAVNLAAITAALCAGEGAHSDPARRYWAAVAAGALYILFGLMAGAATVFVGASPPILIEAVAGLALLGAFGSALMAALNEAKDREAAIVTFLVTGAGLTFLGVSGAFWGLVAGGTVMAVGRWRRSS